jgi:hypothetical protein
VTKEALKAVATIEDALPALVRVIAQASANEAHRLALSDALGLGTGAPWDAIHDRAAELRDELERRTLMLRASRAVVAGLGVYRAAALREAADETQQPEAICKCPGWCGHKTTGADEAQQPTPAVTAEPTPCGHCGHPADWHDSHEGCVGPNGIGGVGSGDCTCTRSPDEAQQPAEDEARQLPCSLWLLSNGHAPHWWQPQRGMGDVLCPGAPPQGCRYAAAAAHHHGGMTMADYLDHTRLAQTLLEQQATINRVQKLAAVWDDAPDPLARAMARDLRSTLTDGS